MRYLASILILALMGLALCAGGVTESRSPGLKLTLEADAPAGVVRDVRVSRMVAIAVSGESPVSPFLPAESFRATWEGFINLKIRGDYVFTAQGSGDLELLVNGQSVLKASGEDLSAQSSARVRMKKGPNAIAARYASHPDRPARIRLLWAERTQPPQPVPPTIFTYDPTDTVLQESLTVRAGRELVAELRCVKCHEAVTPTEVKHAMPELEMDAPSLVAIGSRLRGEWMARWINNPKQLRADASMPRIFKGTNDIDPRVRDVAAYLSSLKAVESEPPPPALPDDVEAGARLFTGLGCIACHTTGPSNDERLSLAGSQAKWQPGALAQYLARPDRHYRWTRMPDFQLTRDEARQLAAYILSRAAAPAEPSLDLTQANATRGRELLVASGCLNCHTLDAPTTLKAPDLAQVFQTDMRTGCLSDDANSQRDAPQFELTAEQSESIRAFAKRVSSLPMLDTPADFADRQVRSLNCVACHGLDAQQDRLSNLKSEIESLELTLPPREEHLTGDQSRPSLTWVGEKLKRDWVSRFIGGEIESRPRPWLEARMPAFRAHAHRLADGLAHQHGGLSQVQPQEPIDAELASIGRKLVGKEGGFACNTCHAVGPAAATSPFEAHGPNLMFTTERFRKDFYHRWVGDPQRYEPGTRMPQYADSKNKTPLRDVLDGDAPRQFEAIWQYLRAGTAIEPPDR